MKRTREVKVGPFILGGKNPVRVQAMCNTDTHDVKSTVKQIKILENAGCEINRVAVPDMDAAKVLGKIKKGITTPLVADIHFDYKLAIEAIKQGVDKVRINPGNIGDMAKVKEVVLACKDKGVAIRIGVNAGSIKELKKFEKVYLKSGETQKISFLLDYIDFAYYNIMLRKYVVENGVYDIYIGASSQDIRLNATFKINDDYSPYSIDCVGESIIG